jgi:murein DD-endopeptidase MepM/ murein hydrolase activator NlpD
MTLALPLRSFIGPKFGIAALLLLTACGGNTWDMRGNTGFNTRELPPPAGNSGLTTYSGYQAITAQRGDTVGSIAQRLGLNGDELARFNAIGVNDPLRGGEVLVLPSTGATPATGMDVSAIASSALDRVQTNPLPPQGTLGSATLGSGTLAAPKAAQNGATHKVARGETAFGIARQYNVSAKTLADWNGLGPDLAVREGQVLIIPVPGAAAPLDASQPGAGSTTPLPPSSKKPLPAEKTPTVAEQKATVAAPAADLSKDVTAASAATFAMPVAGKIIRPYAKGKNDGIDISATAGRPVKAAGAGTVAAVTKDTKGTPIIVLRHAGGLLTVYAGVDGLTVAKGDKVKRGQTIATVRAGDPAFLHFEVRKGVESVDPMGYLQ